MIATVALSVSITCVVILTAIDFIAFTKIPYEFRKKFWWRYIPGSGIIMQRMYEKWRE